MTPQDRDHMMELCRRIYSEDDPKRLSLWIVELNQIIRRKLDELRKKSKF